MKKIQILFLLSAFCILALAPVQAAPTGADDTDEVSVGQSVTIDVLANDTGDNLVIDLNNSAVVYPARKTDFEVVDNKLLYTNNPDENGAPVTGEVTIYYVMRDDSNSTNWATVTITIVENNSEPIANDDAANVTVGGSVIIDALENDSGINLTITDLTDPAQGRAEVINNQLVYTANVNALGDDSVTYTIIDDQGSSAEATLAITIVEDFGSPSGNDDSAEVTVGASVTIDVLANDIGTNLKVDLATSGVAYPVKKTDFTVVDNKLVYSNNSDVNGNPVTEPVTLYYIIRDDLNRTAFATLTVNIVEDRGPPAGGDDTASVYTGKSVSIDVLANDTGTNLTIESVSAAWPVESDHVKVEDNKLVYTHFSLGQGGYPVNGPITIYYVMKDDLGRTNWATVTVTVVENEVIRTYILAGQSNAGGFGLGYGELPFGTLAPNENLDDIGRGDLKSAQISAGIYSRYFSEWRDLEPGFGAGNGFRFGAELSFNSKLQETINEPVRIIKYTDGATTMFSDWQPNLEGNTYSSFMETVNAAKVAADNIGITLDIRGLIWIQGEADSFGQETPPAYESKLNNFISGLRADLNKPDLQVHIGQIPDSDIWIEREQIWAAQQAVVDSDDNAFLVESKGLELLSEDSYGGSQVHWSTRGNVALGELFANSVVAAEPTN